jgi:hypothetical protein
MMRAEKPFLISLIVCMLGAFLLAPGAHGQNTEALEEFWTSLYPNSQVFDTEPTLGAPELLAKAKPDECYNGDYTGGRSTWQSSNCADLPGLDGGCPEGCDPIPTPKVNQAYVWSLTKAGDNLWFGTVANTPCWVSSTFTAPLGILRCSQNEHTVCEYGFIDSQTPLDPFGDWRPPQIYSYNIQTGVLTPRTPDDPLLNDRNSGTLGLRSAGSHGNVVILGGPGGGATFSEGLNLFAYQADTGAYLGSTHLAQYNDIRKWLVVNDVLYTTVQNTAGGGSVLRWTGTPGNPFQFEVVGNLDAMGANLAQHEGRLFVTTWPVLSLQDLANPVLAGLYMSPQIPQGGLNSSHADAWTKVWDVSEYEPDSIVRYTYGGGALASFNGYLYWGTMHVPLLAAAAAFALHGQEIQGFVIDFDADGDGQIGQDELEGIILGTHRPLSLFRGRDFGTPGETVQLLYGLRYLPTYGLLEKGYTIGNDNAHANNAGGPQGVDPLWGLAGFGNPYNAYAWTMAVYGNRLFIGTFDMCPLGGQGLTLFDFEVPFDCELYSGCDLYRVECNGGPAVAEDLTGMGNVANYGIRTIFANNDGLYLGTANPRNLLTDDQGNNLGGWELLKLVSTVEPCSAGGSQPGSPGNGGGVNDNGSDNSDGGGGGGLCFITTAAQSLPLDW